MNLNTKINKYWNYLEKRKKPPKSVNKVNIINFEIIKQQVDKKNEFYLKNFIRKLYNGEAFILRDAGKKKLKNVILKLAKLYDKKYKPSFHKMTDGTPIFIEFMMIR